MRKGAVWACHAYNPAKRANTTSVLRVKVRIYIAFRAVVNCKASIGHHGRLGRHDIPLPILLAYVFNVVSLREGSGAGVEVTCNGASQVVVQRSFSRAFESVEQRESEFVEASAVCAAYAEIVNVTATMIFPLHRIAVCRGDRHILHPH